MPKHVATMLCTSTLLSFGIILFTRFLDTVDLGDFDSMDRAIRKDQEVAFDGQFYRRNM